MRGEAAPVERVQGEIWAAAGVVFGYIVAELVWKFEVFAIEGE